MLKRQGKQNFQRDNTTVASYAEDLGDFYVALLCVEFVSVNLPGKVRSLELKRQVGKLFRKFCEMRGKYYVIK